MLENSTKRKRGRPPKNADGPMYIYGKYTPASAKLSNAYNAKTYFSVRLKKKDKALFNAAAAKSGVSLNFFVEDAALRRVYEVLTEEEIQAALNEDTDNK